jgi:DNA-binding response OmpR family regulator
VSKEEKKELARVVLKRARVVEERPYEASKEALRELSENFGVAALELGRVRFPLSLLQLIPREIAERHQLLPVQVNDETLTVAMSNPLDTKAIDELSFVTGKQVVPLVVPPLDLATALPDAYLAAARGEQFFCGPLHVAEEAAGAEDVAESRSAASASQDFSFAVPDLDFANSAHGPLSRHSQGSKEAPKPAAAAAKRTVLVVEDDDAVLKLMTELLSAAGCNVQTARQGLEAIEQLKQLTPALLVVDAMLPGMHGFDLVRRLQGSRRFSSVPVVVVSAIHRGWEVAEDLRKLGVAHYLEKPFTATRFLAVINEALGVSKAAISAVGAEQLRAGLQAFKLGSMDEALEHLNRAVAADPEAPSLHFHLGLLLGQRGQLFDAISALERAADLDGRDFACIKNLAILYQQAGFLNKSLALWRRAGVLAPDDATRRSIEERVAALAR